MHSIDTIPILGGVQRTTTNAILVVFRENLGHMVVVGRNWSFFKVKLMAKFPTKNGPVGLILRPLWVLI